MGRAPHPLTKKHMVLITAGERLTQTPTTRTWGHCDEYWSDEFKKYRAPVYPKQLGEAGGAKSVVVENIILQAADRVATITTINKDISEAASIVIDSEEFAGLDTEVYPYVIFVKEGGNHASNLKHQDFLLRGMC